VIVHVVRAFNELIAVKKRVKPTVPMIVHGFTKNEQILDSLLRNGFFISIGAAILRGSNGAFKTPQNDQSGFENRVLKIPLNRLFFETDTATVPIQTIYEAYAQLKGIGLEELKAIIFDQHARLY
jgi:TatD DNase family protein